MIVVTLKALSQNADDQLTYKGGAVFFSGSRFFKDSFFVFNMKNNISIFVTYQYVFFKTSRSYYLISTSFR